jgi:hypothetical protein
VPSDTVFGQVGDTFPPRGAVNAAGKWSRVSRSPFYVGTATQTSTYAPR